MSKIKFKNNTKSFDNTKEKIVLIESENIEILVKNNDEYKWQIVSVPNMPFIPIIVKPEINQDKDNIIYRLHFEFPYIHVPIISSYIEEYIISKDKKIKYTKSLNDNYEENIQAPIRYNNKDIHTLSKQKNSLITMNYINKKRYLLFNLNELIYISDTNSVKTKQK